jgi:hypothetical protein
MDPDSDSDADPAIFVIDLQDADKNYCNLKTIYSAYYFLKVQEAQKHTDPTDPDSDPDSQHCFIQVQDELFV